MAGGWRARQWLGMPPGSLMAAMLPRSRQISIVAVRTDPLRLVVAATAPLAEGDVRGTRIRVVGAVAGALADVRRTAQLAVGTPVVCLLDASPDAGAVPGRTAGADDRVSRIVGSEKQAFERTAREAGFAPVGVLTVPDAVTRMSATPPILRTNRRGSDLSPDGDLLLAAAVTAVRGELRRDQPAVDDSNAPIDWAVESVVGATW